MNQDEFFANDDLFFESIPEFNAPNTKPQTSDSNFFETMEWEELQKSEENPIFLDSLFNTEGNIFNNNTISPNNNNDLLFNPHQLSPNNVMIKQEQSQIPQIKIKQEEQVQEELTMEKTPSSKKTKIERSPTDVSTPSSPSSSTPKKKSKKDMTPEELEQKKKLQLEKRLIKNRRTAEISRKRKKAKKSTLEESLIQLAEQSKQLEKQSIEVATENRILKTEYYALLSLILNIPALAQKFDKISEIVVEQQKDNKLGQIASVYLMNLIYSIHQQWIQMKQSLPTQSTALTNPLDIVQNVIVN